MRSREGVRLIALLACLAGVLVYVLVDRVIGGSSSSSSQPVRSACLSPHRPEVRSVAPPAVGSLRESVARVLPERIGRLYEEGTIVSANAWNDDRPLGPAISPSAPRPAGYEMRWWAPDGDDVVADAFEFHTFHDAQLFLARAASAHCRLTAHARPALQPLRARNLTWVNPDQAAEVDLYVARGKRVYRIGDVPPGQRHGRASPRELARALLTVDALACLLPHSACTRPGPSVPA